MPIPAQVPLTPGGGTWSSHDGAPVSVPRQVDAVWTGRVLVVLEDPPEPDEAGTHGQRLAVWDATEDAWTSMEAPISARPGAVLAWTDRELLVLGGGGIGAGPRSDGAAWDPSSGRWRVLPDAPAGVVGGVWTGRRLHAWVRSYGRLDVHAYAPGADAWQAVESEALRGMVAGGAGYARGRRLVWGRSIFSGTSVLLLGETNVEVGVPPGFDASAVAVADQGLLALGVSAGRPAGARFVLGRGWEPLPTMYERAADADRVTSAAWTGSRLLFGDGSTVVAHDPSTRRWEDLGLPDGVDPGADADVLAWTGDRALVWVSGPGRQPGALYSWRLQEPADG